MIDEKDRLFLSCLRKGLDFVSRPFDALGARIGTDGADVILRLERLKRGGVIAGVRTFWDATSFRCRGAWAAMNFPAGTFDQKAEIIHRHPGILYSVERAHEINFWCFVVVPAGHDPETHIRILARQTGAVPSLYLPLRKVLKGPGPLISLAGQEYAAVDEGEERRQSPERSELSLDEIRLIRLMQDDLPETDEPFHKIAEAMNAPEAIILNLLKGLSQKGHLKRIGSYTRARSAMPASTLRLVVWQVPGEKMERIAGCFEEIPEVICADTRPGYPEFPYTVYTLIRAADPAALEVLVRRIEEKIGRWPNRVIPPVREIRKVPMRYFPAELDAWWIRNRLLADPVLQNNIQ